MGWRNGGYASVLLVAIGAAMWGAVFALDYLNAKAPAPDPSAPVIGTG